MSTPHRTYSRQVIAAWLHGYTTGHNIGFQDGRAAGNAEGYDHGHADGIPAGRRLADDEAAAKWHAYRTWFTTRPNRAVPRPLGEVRPLQTPAECLATWTTPSLPAAHQHAA